MVKKINIGVLVSMILVVIASGIFYMGLNKQSELMPKPLYALFNLFLVIILINTPNIFKKMNMEISNGLYLLVLFSFMVAFVGGMTFKLYTVIYSLDTIAHLFNGGVIAIVGFAFIKPQFQDWEDHITLLCLMALFFSLSVGVIWEIYEFVSDLITSGNMQRHTNIFTDPHVKFIGQEALMDTMIDLIVDSIGAVVASFMLYFSSTRKQKFANLFSIEYIKNDYETKKQN